MPPKRQPLGQLLLQAGLLADTQIEAALKSQLFFGGRFGTNAVETESVTLDMVASALSQQLGVPAAPQEALLAVRPDTLQRVPASLCTQYKVFPMLLEGKVLHLAMMDPLDLAANDEVSFTLGVRIRPYVIPELRLHYHLERAFGIPRDARYLRLRGEEKHDPRRRYLAATPSREPAAPARHAAAPPAPQASGAADSADELVFLDSFTSAAPRAPTSAPTHAPDPASVAETLRGPLPAAAPDRPPDPVWSEGTDVPLDFEDELPERFSVAEALAAIERATTRDDVISALAACEIIPDALQVLFVVRGEMATALKAVGCAAQGDEVRRLVVPLASGATLRAAFGERRLAAGPARHDPVQYVIASVLRAPPPAEVCVAPICLADRVVNLLYLQVAAGGTIPTAAQEQMVALCEHAAAAYLRLIRELKEK